MTEGGRSGRERGAENVAVLRAYLDALGAEGRRLPERGGRVNLSAVALSCGFDRQVLYANPGARTLLEDAVGRLGLDLPDQPRTAADPAAPGAADPRDRRIHRLEQTNTELKAENTALRAERNRLRAEVERLRHVEAHMVETGRRVPP